MSCDSVLPPKGPTEQPANVLQMLQGQGHFSPRNTVSWTFPLTGWRSAGCPSTICLFIEPSAEVLVYCILLIGNALQLLQLCQVSGSNLNSSAILFIQVRLHTLWDSVFEKQRWKNRWRKLWFLFCIHKEMTFVSEHKPSLIFHLLLDMNYLKANTNAVFLPRLAKCALIPLAWASFFEGRAFNPKIPTQSHARGLLMRPSYGRSWLQKK